MQLFPNLQKPIRKLEKIRLEEQRKKEALQAANVLANNAIGSASDPSFGPNLSHSPNSVQLPASPNALYRSAPLGPTQMTKQSNGNGDEIGLQAVSSPGNGSWPRLDNLGFSFSPQVNVQYEPNTGPVVPLTGVPQRSYQFQRPPSSVVNASSGISPPFVLSSQMEPPSNQSFCGNNYTSLWPEEDKIVGMKRPYPFSLESPPPTPSFLRNSHPTFAASRSRSDELPSSSSGYTAQTEPRNKYIRDGPSNSTPLPEQNPSEVIRDDVPLNGDFLTLAPPVNSKNKHPFDYSGHQGPEISDNKSLPSQQGPSVSKEQPFSFFPIKSPTDQITDQRNGNGDKETKLISI
ncbi:hypothetical protein DH2020_031700 [Rehmannia glutinosa]|uniref:Uncharacterized protein n=1 Tax=Rehmannia glutinosa TaxID=99300 RepID=A0ABR0VL81_REHGL